MRVCVCVFMCVHTHACVCVCMCVPCAGVQCDLYLIEDVTVVIVKLNVAIYMASTPPNEYSANDNYITILALFSAVHIQVAFKIVTLIILKKQYS